MPSFRPLAALLIPLLTAASGEKTQAVPNQAAPAQAGGRREGTLTRLPTNGLKAVPFKSTDGKTGWKVTIPGGRALATPAVVGGTVFVGGGFGSNEFYAFDAQTGRPRWAVRVSDDGPTAAVVAEGRVVFNTESCTLFVLDAETGRLQWSRWLGDPLMSQPAVHGGNVYMAYPGSDGRHHLIALALKDGREKWQGEIAGDIISAPVVENDSVYLSTNDGTVYRFKEGDGALVWKKAMHATSAPWIAEDGVHVAQAEDVKVSHPVRGSTGGDPATAPPASPGESTQKQEGYRTLNLNGQPTTALQAARPADWLDADTQDKSGYAAHQKADDSSVGFSTAPASAGVGAAKANLGQANVRGLWEFQGSRPLVIGQTNYTTQGDAVRALEGPAGKDVWDQKLSGDVKKVGGALGAPPAFAAGKLVVATASGCVNVYLASSGKQLGHFELGQEIRFQPALWQGRIYVGSATGTLFMIDSGDTTLDGWTMWGGGPRHNGPEKG